jgi:hypothetical protein
VRHIDARGLSEAVLIPSDETKVRDWSLFRPRFVGFRNVEVIHMQTQGLL